MLENIWHFLFSFMNHALAYLHSIGFSQSNLSRIFAQNTEYESYFQSFSRTDLELLGMKPERIDSILENREKIQIEKMDDTIRKFSIRLVTIHDAEYPRLLKNISHPPYFLYVRGTLRDTTDLISVVGSRKNSKYAEIALEKIIPDLISAGFGVVSGGAYGVDALSHAITLAHSGYTIAVVGTGVDLVYPLQNRELFARMLDSG